MVYYDNIIIVAIVRLCADSQTIFAHQDEMQHRWTFHTALPLAFALSQPCSLKVDPLQEIKLIPMYIF